MKFTKKMKVYFIGFLFVISSISFLPLFNSSIMYNSHTRDNNKNDSIAIAKYWDNFTFFHIDNNWTAAKGKGWVQGDGTKEIPYLIENFTIDASTSSSGYGILIENTDKYFKINNCTIFNAANSGIKLSYTSNGTISSCNLSYSSKGITIENSNITLIVNNTLDFNSEHGIYLDNPATSCINTTIVGNNISNSYYGIELEDSLEHHYVNISENRVINCSMDGMYLRRLKNCTISNNYIKGCQEYAIWLDGTGNRNNTVRGNTMINGGINIFGTLTVYSTHVIDQTNTVNGKLVYYYVQEPNLTNENFTNAGQIMVFYGDNVEIYKQNISDVYRAINIQSTDNVSVNQCNFTNIRGQGVRILLGNNHTVFNSNFSGAFENAIEIASADNCTIKNNNFYSSNSSGIRIYRCEDVVLRENIMRGCGILFEVGLESELVEDIDTSNLVNGKPVYYYYNVSNLNPINFSNAGQIIICKVNSSIIANVNLSRGAAGLTSYYCRNISIDNINASYCRYHGLLIMDAGNHSITNSHFKKSEQGVYINQDSFTYESFIVFNNTIEANTEYGLRMDSSAYNNISSNRFIENRQYAVFLTELYNSTLDNNNITGSPKLYFQGEGLNITNNYFENCSMYALRIGGDNHTLVGNTFNNCTLGIECYGFDSGLIEDNYFIRISGYSISFDSNSEYNQVSLNNFTNSQGVYAYDAGTANQWHNGTHGNYWDDYTGKDTNDNGIGDSSYINIDGGASVDPYPLWWDAPVISVSDPANNTVSNSTSPIITLSVDEGVAGTFWYNIEGDLTLYNFTGLSGKINQTAWTALANGSVLIHFYANDSRNYVGRVDHIVKKDVKGPLITIQNPVPSKVFSSVAPNASSCNVNILDGNGVDDVWYKLYNATFETDNATWSGEVDSAIWLLIQNGTITLRIYANDSIGNVNFSEVKLYKDIKGPHIAIILNENTFGDSAPTGSELSATIQDGNGISKQWYMLYSASHTTNNHTWTGTIAQAVWEEFDEDQITLRIYANDTLGNINWTEVTFEKEPDNNGDKDKGDDDDTEPPTVDSLVLIIIGIGAVAAVVLIFLKAGGKKDYKSSDKAKREIDDIFKS
ncbi:MAG: right-handed parallel beta-helix repeat-containing protein [Promethearchaeota archaeon]